MTNEWYAKDISKKRKIVNKMKGNAGIPLSQPPYGYIKNPDDSRFWVIDPEAADVVRRIYDMALEGYGLAEIANALGVDGIVNPTYYWRSKGVNRSGSKSTLEPTKWGHTTIKKILTLQECARLIKKQREVFGSGYRKKPQNMTRTAALRFRNTQKRSRANKNRIQPTGTPRTRNVSPGRFLFENLSFSQVKSRRK